MASNLYPEIYEELYSYAELQPVMNTHSHHMAEVSEGYNLDTLLRSSYVNWLGETFDQTPESRRSFLEKVRFNSYFVWLEKGIQSIYDFNESITEKNWELISGRISDKNKSSDYHLLLLKDRCNYQKIILDAYWNPGFNNNSDLFAPTFRIDMFLNGYEKDKIDRNGNNAASTMGFRATDIDEYTAGIRETILKKKSEGCVALKLAMAYERDLNFAETAKEKAQAAMTIPKERLTPEDIKAFGDYVFFQICGMAAELNLPVQCHVGLGILKNTNAMQMQEVIHKNRQTKFVLFHGSYPWLDDVLGLAHNYSNIYPDLCWLPQISTAAAERMLVELIDVATINKICWGCDTWTSEESVGGLLAIRHVLASALSKRVCEKYFTIEAAKSIIEGILYKNAKEIYGL